jgi:hypothetical protein
VTVFNGTVEARGVLDGVGVFVGLGLGVADAFVDAPGVGVTLATTVVLGLAKADAVGLTVIPASSPPVIKIPPTIITAIITPTVKSVVFVMY